MAYEYQFEIFCAFVAMLFVFLGYLYRSLTLSYNYFKNQDIPGPKTSFIFGTWSGAWKKFLGSQDIEISKEFGKYVGTFDGTTPNLLVTDPEAIKLILSTEANKFFDKRAATTKNVLLRNSLRTLSCTEDSEINNLIKPAYGGNNIEKLFPRLESSVDSFIKQLQKSSADGSVIEINKFVSDFLIDALALSVYGIDLHADIEFRDEFVKNSSQIYHNGNSDSPLALIPYLYEKLSGDSWIFPKSALNFFTQLTTKSLKERPRGAVNVESKASDLVDLLIQASEDEKNILRKDDPEGGVLSEDVLTSQCLAAVMDLSHTSRNVLILSLYTLAVKQDIQEKLFIELKKISASLENGSFDEAKSGNFLDLFVSEILRYYPTEFRIERICRESIVTESLRLENGTRVSIPLFALHHNEELYPEPDAFNPDRHTTEANAKRTPFSYLPYGQAGHKSSSITNIALLEVKLALSKLVEKFKISIDDSNVGFPLRKGFTGVPVPGNLLVKLDVRV